MRRRQFLATGTALLPIVFAGCGHPPPYNLEFTEATPTVIADQFSSRAEAGSTEYEIVTAALENGSTTWDGRRPVFGGQDTVRVDGAVYDVSETAIDSREVTVYTVKIDYKPADTTAQIGEIQYENLPAVDKNQLGEMPPSRDWVPDTDGYDVSARYGTAEEVGDESVFVPDQEYDIIVFEGSRYRIGVESRTDTESTYEYEVIEVASSVEAYAAQLRAEYLFALTGLSEAEQTVVEEAIESEYNEDSKEFQSILDKLQEHKALYEGEYSGWWLLTYQNVAYVARAGWA